MTGTVALMLESDQTVIPAPGASGAQICWGADAAGAGLLDAAAAVAATTP